MLAETILYVLFFIWRSLESDEKQSTNKISFWIRHERQAINPSEYVLGICFLQTKGRLVSRVSLTLLAKEDKIV